MDIDLEELASLVELLKAAEFSEFRYDKGDLHITIRRGGASPAEDPAPTPVPVRKSAATPAAPPVQRVAAPRSAPAASIPEGAKAVTAPLLGTFYARSKPGEAPFVKVGDVVKPDTVLCIVEVMKLMNSVNAGCHGVIAAVHVEDGQLVEFGQALFSIVPSGA
jgi:acetyl-CoA carboxylase biotin carboxyl carrier protein